MTDFCTVACLDYLFFLSPFRYMALISLVFVFHSAFTITFIVRVNWPWEQIFIVSNTKLNQNGRIPFVLMEGNGL